MKKIFAFVLATIMVLSLVPASAFAAVTKCPATHTTTNCEFTKVKTVAATCEKAGYTEYVCNACGEPFVDNLKPKAKHTWVSNPDKAAGDILANCVYQANGIQYLICSVCEVEYGTDGYKTIDYNSVSVHNLVHVSGVGCEKLYACTLCGAEGYINSDDILTTEEAHTWEFTEMESEPYWSKGKKYSGMAIFTCEDCGATKKVTVDTPACQHPAHTDKTKATVVAAAKAPTCSAKGQKLVVKCPDCNAHWYCKTTTTEEFAGKTTNANCLENHKNMNDHNWATLSDGDSDGNFKEHAELSKFNHVKTQMITDLNKNGAYNCGDTYLCGRCSTYQTQGHNGGDKVYYIQSNCTTKGQYVQQCKDCGQYVYGTDSSAGKHITVKTTLPATCVSPAVYIEYCSRDNCTTQKTLINGKYYSLLKEPEYRGNPNTSEDGHNFIIKHEPTNIGNVNPDVYCSGMSYTYKMCANGCAQYGAGYTELVQPVVHNFVPYKTVHNYMSTNLVVDGAVIPQWTTRQWVKCTNPNCENPMPKVPYTDIPDTSIKTTFASETEALEYHGLIATYWTLNAKGEKVVDTTKGIDGYEGLGAYAGMTVDAIINLVFGQPQLGLSTTATCSAPATNVYLCKDCNTYVWVQGGTAAHALTNFKAGKDATCTTAGSYDTYKCSICNVTYWFDAAGKVHTESAAKNPCSDTLVPVPGSCGDENGYWKCTVCNTCYTDATASTKYVPSLHNYVTLLDGSAASCNTTGYPEIRYCADCGVLEINLVYVNGGKEIRVNFNETGYKYKQNTVTVALTDAYLSEAVTVTVAIDGSVSFVYHTTEYDAEEEEEVPADFNWTEWPAYVTVKKMETKYNHRGLYVKATGELAINTTEPYAASAVEFKNSESPKTYSYSVLDHSKPSFDLVECEACVYEFVKNYVAAKGGHVNAKGKLIDVNGCNDDAVCVICKKYADEHPDEEVKYEFGAHNYEKTGENTATCSTSGYVAYRCTKCGEYDISGEIVETVKASTWHKNLLKGKYADQGYIALLDGIDADFAHNGSGNLVCPVCNEVLKNLDEVDCPGAGLEIYVSADAASYVPGSVVYVTITLDSLMGVNVWGLNFPVVYDTNCFDFVEAEFNTATSAFQTFAVNEVAGGYHTSARYDGKIWTDGQYNQSGTIVIAANADDEVTIKGAQVLATLKFVVTGADATANAFFKVAENTVISGGAVGSSFKEVYKDVIAAEKEDNFGFSQLENMFGSLYQLNTATQTSKTYEIYAVNGFGKRVPTNVDVEAGELYTANTEYVEILGYLDLDENGEYNMMDAYTLYALIYNNEYDMRADADLDGYVTVSDLTVLYSIIVGVKTPAQIITNMVTESPEIPEGWTAMDGAK